MLVDLLKEEYRQHAERHILRTFAEEVASFMKPFNPGKIQLEIEQSLHKQAFLVHIQNLGDFRFPMEFGDSVPMDQAILQLSEIYRESRVEPEEHIILGLE